MGSASSSFDLRPEEVDYLIELTNCERKHPNLVIIIQPHLERKRKQNYTYFAPVQTRPEKFVRCTSASGASTVAAAELFLRMTCL